MKKSTKISTLGRLAIAAAASLVVSCGGDSSDDTPLATATAIDAASVTKGIAMVSTLVPVCSSPGASQTAAVQGELAPAKIVWLAKRVAQAQSPQRRILALGSMPPTDLLGGCGGRLTYPASAFSHLNGVTTATLAFENHCTVNTDTNTRLVLNGSLAFVDNGTPSASGPIRNWISAESPAGVTIATQDVNGVVIDAMLVRFSNFRYTVGVPGGTPTAASPDRFTLGELGTTTQSTGKSYRATGFSGEYFDMTTSTPLVLDVDGNPTGGAIKFSGANESTAIATLMPGAVL